MNLLSVFLISTKRLWNNKGLALCSVLGLVAAVALISSVPLYADAANYQSLQEELAKASGKDAGTHPPFVFMYRYIGAWNGALEIEDYEQANAYITQSVPGVVGLPLESASRLVKTQSFKLFSVSEAAYGTRQPLSWVNLGFMADIEGHIRMVEGQFPEAVEAEAGVIDVLVSQRFVEETGLQTGESYVVFRASETAVDGQALSAAQWTVRIAGVWAATDATEAYWASDPSVLDHTLLLPEATFRANVAPAIEDEIYTAVWYMVFDGSAVRADDVPGLISRMDYANIRVGTLMPNTKLDVSPLDELANYRWITFVMMIILYVFSIPILGLVLYFIGMVSGLLVERQRGEIVMLKGRGASDGQVLGIYAFEGLLMGVLGFAGGLFIGRQLALVMGNTLSFLVFGQRQRLPVEITPQVLYIALAGILVSLLTSILPAMRAARLTMVSYRADRARSLTRPVWQRYFMDFVLLAPAVYVYHTLQESGSLGFLSTEGSTAAALTDPLLFMAPTLSLLAGALVIGRLFPLLMELGGWLTGRFSDTVSLVLAFRQLARVSRQYSGALLLLVLTLSLATFTASMALTLNQSLADRTYYRNGADYFLVETGEEVEPSEEMLLVEEQAAVDVDDEDSVDDDDDEDDLGWTFVPVSEHRRVADVEGATRVGSYAASIAIAGVDADGPFFGIDRADFAQVAYFRDDFSPSQLATLMDHLATDSSALLVSPEFLQKLNLKVGDRVELTVEIYDRSEDIIFTIADVISYFPTFYPTSADPYLFVGNLDYLFEEMGGEYPYDVWLRTSTPVAPEKLQEELAAYDLRVTSIRDSRAAIAEEQAEPERTGMFGILSVGFVAAALLTLVGFTLYILISLRRRYVEFGVLRAIGLSVGQMIGILGIEQALLILVGMTAGTGLGVLVSRLYIPFLQVGSGANVTTPPFQVLIAWGDVAKIYAVFLLMLAGAVGGMIWYLKRLKIFEAVKLGEAV